MEAPELSAGESIEVDGKRKLDSYTVRRCPGEETAHLSTDVEGGWVGRERGRAEVYEPDCSINKGVRANNATATLGVSSSYGLRS